MHLTKSYPYTHKSSPTLITQSFLINESCEKTRHESKLKKQPHHTNQQPPLSLFLSMYVRYYLRYTPTTDTNTDRHRRFNLSYYLRWLWLGVAQRVAEIGPRPVVRLGRSGTGTGSVSSVGMVVSTLKIMHNNHEHNFTSPATPSLRARSVTARMQGQCRPHFLTQQPTCGQMHSWQGRRGNFDGDDNGNNNHTDNANDDNE